MRKHLNKSDAPKQITQNEKVLGDNDFIVSKTDTKGIITYCNQIFTQMSGYEAGDLIGANHNLIRHPDMPKLAFKLAWELIQNKKEFFGFVKNLTKDGGYYWVYTYITPDLDSTGNIIGYTSFRRKPKRNAIEAVIPLYRKLLEAEREGGVSASQALLQSILREHNTTYDAFVITLQSS